METNIIIDENLSPKLTVWLDAMFTTITHVSSEGLTSGFDIDIWRYAKDHSLAIITKDMDFKNLSIMYGCPPKVIMINCGNKTTIYISKLLISKKEVIDNFLADDKDCYLELI